jgi:hypothetical protein
MSRFILALIVISGIAVPKVQAQRYLPGMRGLQCTAGTVNGFKPEEGFQAGVAFSVYTKRADRWVFGVEYLEKRHPYSDMFIPQLQFTLDAGYFLKFLSDRRKMFFISVGASAVAGYEIIYRGQKLLPDGATINNADAFLYGGAITLELETYLMDRIVLLVNVRERVLMGSSAGKLNTLFGIGLKIIIN